MCDGARQLGVVERWTAVLAALTIAVSSFTCARPVALGVSLGAALMVINTWALRRIGQRVVASAKRPGAAVLLFNVKMALLLALVYVVVRYLAVDAVGFIVGVSVFPAAVLCGAVQVALRGTSDGDGDGDGDDADADSSSDAEDGPPGDTRDG